MKLPALTPTLHFHFMVQPFLVQQMSGEGIVLQADEYALTGCNLGTGTVSTEYNMDKVNQYGPPDCLITHENVHVNYQTSCCQRAKLCFDKTTGNTCLNAFNKWRRENSSNEECLAYKAEFDCLTQHVNSGRYNSGAVALLNQRLAEAKKFGDAYCKKAKSTPCPFTATGDIA